MDAEEAKQQYNARKCLFKGSVEVSIRKQPWITGYCCNCGRQLIDYDINYYTDWKTRLCKPCFELFEKFKPVIIHHYPGFIDNGRDYEIYVWEGYEQFLVDRKPEDGWHYEQSDGCIMFVRDDLRVWRVLWHVRNKSIFEELKNKMKEWKHN